MKEWKGTLRETRAVVSVVMVVVVLVVTVLFCSGGGDGVALLGFCCDNIGATGGKSGVRQSDDTKTQTGVIEVHTPTHDIFAIKKSWSATSSLFFVIMISRCLFLYCTKRGTSVYIYFHASRILLMIAEQHHALFVVSTSTCWTPFRRPFVASRPHTPTTPPTSFCPSLC